MGALFLIALLPCSEAPQEGPFERLTLANEFLCEGASFADLDRDGHADVIAGPYWYPGPSFTTRREIYAPQAFDPASYSDNFFAFPYDFDGDDWIDVLFVGFPGEAATWYANPRTLPTEDRHWEKHVVVEHVDGESPAFTDLTGDGVPELVFLAGGRLGWAGPPIGAPEKPWPFHPVSEDLGLQRFTHGLGVGDVDGDGRADILLKDGWCRQPESLAGDPLWRKHPHAFSTRHGGAQMLVQDVDGDGDSDVITSLAAHEFGLSWWEQVPGETEIAFVEHRIMDEKPEDNTDGVCFGELHALESSDIDGDGLQDIVTGKRWWSHGAKGDPDGGAVPAVVYAFLLRRDGTEPASGQAHYQARLLDDDSGVGTQVVVGDVDGDGKPDVVIGNKKGTFLLRNEPSRGESGAPSPTPQAPGGDAGEAPRDEAGALLELDFEDGTLGRWTRDGEAFAGQPVRGDTVAARGRESSRHQGEWWIGGYERVGDGQVGSLTSAPFSVTHPWASFLIGGGGGEGERVELRRLKEDGKATPFFFTSAGNFETMQRVVVDLRAELGHRIDVHLVDEERGGWGHINFDDFRFHGEKPSYPRPPGVPAIRPRDAVPFAGLSPTEAVAAMDVPAGFHVDLVASEPELHQPIALAVDPKGRLWVVEAFTYPRRAPDGEGQDQILVFEDRDHDGSFETRTVFAKGLNLVSGMEVGFGGVWVGAAPNLLFLPDRNDDLIPDGPPEVLLDGWGYEDTHETLNAFTWGPDGWLYGCHGVFTHSRVGRPGTPEAERTPLNAGVWRYHPVRHEFEVFAWGTSNPWGVTFDATGQCFVTACVIPHLFHLSQGGRYRRQAGRHFNAYVFEDIDTVADHRHYIGDSPHGGNLRSNAAGGGHAHCGALLYQADAFPPEWRGRLLMNNIHGNRINADELVPDGSGFTGRHAPDLLVANDKWFRGIALELSPEASLYLIDWYDEQACHLNQPEVWDRTNGRLYRIRYGDLAPLHVDLSALPSRELVELQFHSNEWFARRARVLLQERGADAEVVRLLASLLREKPMGERALRALWALHAVAGLDDGLGRELLGSEDAWVRAWTIQCLLEQRSPSKELLGELVRLAREDPSPIVRRHLASGLQRLPVARRFELARALVAHGEDEHDPNLPLLVWYGIEPLVVAEPERAMQLAREARIEKVVRFLYRRAASEPSLRESMVEVLAQASGPRRRLVLDEWVNGVRDERGLSAPKGWPELYPSLAGDPDPHVSDQALELAIAFGDRSAFPALRALVETPSVDSERRGRALDALVRGRDPRSAEVLLARLDDEALRAEALRGLAVFDAEATAPAVLARYPRFSAPERRDALATLGARASWARDLLAAVGAGQVPRSELSAFQLRALRQLGDAEVDRLLDEHVGQVRPADEDKEAQIARVRTLLEGKGPDELARGREVFARTCQNCHALFLQGGALGPDLTGANRGDREYLLSNVLDPSGVVTNEYRTTVAWLQDGRVVTGIERGRTQTSVTLQTETERVTLSLDEIEELALSPLSTMPEGLLDALDDEETRALFAYLASSVQAPLLATPANQRGFFDGASLENWHGAEGLWGVEDGEIVGRTDGLARNEFLRSEYELGDFRLSLEVRLLGNQGNSGIQFRSRERAGGDVEGYQADIGEGWWGKLYEEHGRALLVERGATNVREDGWNHYVIECRGARVRTWLNDEPCVDLEDPEGARSGIVALQLHSGGATEVRFRRLALELL